MTYPGNPSLSSELQQRILGTFEQTLGLAAEGSRQEALLGCDFVLRMDPQFEPARRLQERLKTGAGAVRVEDLQLTAAAPAAATSEAVPEELFSDLEGFDLPELPLDVVGTGAGGVGLAADLQDLLEQRRFQELMTRAQQESAAVTADPDLRRIVEAAQERMEAEPYLNKFLGSAREALKKGETNEVERLLLKAESLDASHPAIAELRAQARRSSSPSLSEETPLAGFDLADSPAIDLGAPVPGTGFGFGGGGGGLGSGDSESDRRIQQLLDEGQASFDAGDPQAAIDAWSRIFLIDIDHQEAARRIERARKLKAESERQVEEVFHDGLAQLEASNLEGARQAFQQVLQIQPGHLAAREYLQQIESGVMPTPRPHMASLAGDTHAPVLAGPGDLDDLGAADGGEDLKEEILVPPDPNEAGSAKRAPAERREPKVAVARRRGGRTFLIVGAAVLALVAVGGWFAYTHWSDWFPNSDTAELEPMAQPPAAKSPIDRAKALHDAGKTPNALAQLRRIPPNDPYYKEAQALIAQWEAAASPVAAQPSGPSIEVQEQRQELIDSAKEAYTGKSYLRAIESFEKAAALIPLDAADAEMLASAKTRVEPLARYLTLYRQEEWEYAVPDLWRMRESDPGNPDIHRLLVDSYYNMGVRDLQRADAQKAREKFEEAMKLEPNDEAVRRNFLFAQTYQERPKDLLYRIYVKYLQFRK